MPNVLVNQNAVGAKLAEDVTTALGGVLYRKGKVLTVRDIEILQAFLVKTIPVGSRDAKDIVEEPSEDDKQESAEEINFNKAYEQVHAALKKYFFGANSGVTPPLLELRQKLEQLIIRSDQYSVLTYAPRRFELEDYVYHNSILVALTSYKLAQWHNLERKDWVPIAMAGLLHDIGMIRVDFDILKKRAKLNASDMDEVKKHTVMGYNMLKSVTGINEGVKLAALQHHEREDGSGYPLGLMADKIHPYSKVIAIADMFHAMTNERYHKKKTSPYFVLEELLKESFGKLNPHFVQTFIHKVTQFHNGTLVKLSDNSIGEIVFSDRSHPTRPWVNVNGRIINLTVERSLYIQEVLNT